jgi:hypothetical protein
MLAGAYCGDHTWISAPTREFLYLEDAAEGILLAVECCNDSEPVKPGSAFETCPAEGVEGSAFL